MKKWWLLVLILLLLLLAFLFGGEVIAVLSPPPTNTPTPIVTNTPFPTDTSTPTSTSTAIPTATPTPTETPIPCFTLQEPEDGAELDGTMGKLTFAWTEQYGAAGYLFAITIPSGYVEEKELTDTGFERWLESLPLGGEYSWVVEAVNGEGDVLCTAGPFTFSKSEYAAPSNNTGTAVGSSGGGGLDPNGDADGDGLLNGDDACPFEGGPPSNNGCPPGGQGD